MGRLRRATGRTLYLALFSIGWASCSGPGSGASGRDQGPHPIPFRDGAGDADSVSSSLPTTADPVAAQERGVPFRDPESLPAGTLITVRLSSPVTSDSSNSASPTPEGTTSSDTFEASVDEPIVIDGVTVVPRGTSVAGRVESARSFEQKLARGASAQAKLERDYVRLILDSMDVAGRPLSIRTSSLFARARPQESKAGRSSTVVSIEPGRRLTFQLSEPVYIALQPTISSR